MSAGIDYGMGRTNVDHETGIRVGVISQHSVTQAWADSAEPDYGKPTCPKCGNDAIEYEGDKHNEYAAPYACVANVCADYVCESCKIIIDSGDAFSKEPQGWTYNDDGYQLVDCLDSDVMVIKSPFYTLARFCSPCVPGAGDLDSADETGIKTYCLGHDWFEDGKAPYPVYDVQTGTLVEST